MGAIAAIAAGVIGAGLGAYGASEQAGATEEAGRLNAQAQENINALLVQFAREQEGEGGKPVFLPRYTGGYEAGTLFPQAQAIYDVTGALLQGTPAEQAMRYKAIAEAAQPGETAAQRIGADIFSGALTKERLAEQVPVEQAGARLALTQKQGILDDLVQRTNALLAADARKGYVGTGSAVQTAAQRTAIPFRQAAAATEAGQDLATVQRRAAIQEQGRQLKLQSLGLPVQLAQQQAALTNFPAQALAQAYQTRLQPFQFFQRRSAAPPAVKAPTYPVIPTTGQIVAQALGGTAGSLGNYFATQQLINQLNQGGYGPGMVQTSPGVYSNVANLPEYGAYEASFGVP